MQVCQWGEEKDMKRRSLAQSESRGPEGGRISSDDLGDGPRDQPGKQERRSHSGCMCGRSD